MSYMYTIREANALMVQHLAYSYLSFDAPTSIVAGASILTRRIANRTNVPANAITLSHFVEHSELGFSFRFRSVWYDGELYRPTATHVVIEKEWDDGEHGNPAAVSAAINDWLQAVTP